jgi:6-phosphogluconolactonase
VNRQRQEGPHAHFIIADPKNRFVSCCDLGLDKVLVYKLNAAAASLVPNEPPAFSVAPGAGPRHLAFGPDGKRAYIVHEMGCAVVSCGYDQAKGVFTEVGTVSTLPEGFKGNNSCAEIQVHPNGKFVYASNRGHDSIAVFSADKQGRLSLVQHESTQGKTPRHFTLDPSGKWLLAENQGSDSIVSFQVDPKTGRLTPCGGKVEVGSPVCLVFAP